MWIRYYRLKRHKKVSIPVHKLFFMSFLEMTSDDQQCFVYDQYGRKS